MPTALALAPAEHAPTPTIIPGDQRAEWMSESTAARRWVADHIRIFEPLLTTKGREKLWPSVGRRLGIPPGTAKKRYFKFAQGVRGECFPMWEALIDRSRFKKPREKSLDARFIQYWIRLQEDQKRMNDGILQAHRELLWRLDHWEQNPLDSARRIPGHTSPPLCTSWCSLQKRNVPEGWSYSNLVNHKPTVYHKTVSIIGPKAASSFLRGNLKTRVGLKYRQIVFFDDQHYDNNVIHFANSGEPARPEGFNGLDYLTLHFESYGVQLPRRELTEDGKKGSRRGINQEAYIWCQLSDFIHNGFRDDEVGTTIGEELGTAATPKWFKEQIYNLTGGRVTYESSGRHGQSAFAEAFLGKGAKLSSGNFRSKAAIESSFQLVRTYSAGLLGATSQNERLLGPEQNAAIKKHHEGIFRDLQKLPEEKRGPIWRAMQFYEHNLGEFSALIDIIYKLINSRKHHKPEGWESCGFVIPGYSLPMPGDPTQKLLYTRNDLALLDAESAALIRSVGKMTPYYMSPAEAKKHCLAVDGKNIRRLEPHQVVSLLPEDWAYPLRFGGARAERGLKVDKNGLIKILDRERFGPDPIFYEATVHHDAVAFAEPFDLRPGTQCCLHVDPFNLQKAYLLGEGRKFLGMVHLHTRAPAGDSAAILRNQGKINQHKARMDRPVRRRHADQVEIWEAKNTLNRRLLDGTFEPDQDDIEAERHRLAMQSHHAASDRGEITLDPDEDGASEAMAATASHAYSDDDIFLDDDDIDR